MTQRFEGQCQCGAVKYRVEGIPVTLFACHCTECQRQSSSAFGMALWIKDAEVHLLADELTKWIRHLPSGRDMECSFCSTCGTRLFHRVPGQSQFMSIKPGTLNDTKWLKPVGHIWTASKQTWMDLDEQVLQYTGNPENFDGLLCAWKEAHA